MIKIELDIDGSAHADGDMATTVAIVAGGTGIVAFVAYVVLLLLATAGSQQLHQSLLHIPVVMSAGVVVVSLIYLFAALSMRRRMADVTFEPVASALSVFAISSLALLLVSAVLPLSFVDGMPNGWLSVVTASVIAVGVIGVTIGMATAIVRILLTRPHRWTRRNLIAIASLLAVQWIAEAIGADWAHAIGILSVMAGALLTLISIRRMNWVVTLTLDKKVRLLWLALCAAFAVIVLFALMGAAEDTVAARSVGSFLYGAVPMVIALNVYALIFIVRLFGAVLAALPNSGIVDRRSNEVESLSYLTRLIADSATTDELLASVTRLSQGVCRAHGAWCETYDTSGVQVVSTQLLDRAYVTSLQADRELQRLVMQVTTTTRFDDLLQRLPTSPAAHIMRSLIVVPLLQHHRRAGSLVMMSTVPYGFDRDDVRLAAAFGDTVSVALDQARLSAASAERERMHREFEVAQRIQASLLPSAAPRIPGIDLNAVMIPASEVGGDYFDYVTFANGNHGVIIADVAGKGVPAALYMATLKGVVLAAARTANGPADLLRRVNATLFGSMERSTYITIACVEIDTVHGSFTFARAGHTPSLLRSGEHVRSVCPQGMAIGIAGASTFDAQIVEETIAVQAGDICLLTTDGVTERRNGARTEIQLDAISSVIAQADAVSAANVVRQTLAALDGHAGGADAHDDITIAAIVCTTHDSPSQPAS